jgi:hypothetical protein
MKIISLIFIEMHNQYAFRKKITFQEQVLAHCGLILNSKASQII